MHLKALPKAIVETLRSGGVGVLPTDTLYGVVGSALKSASVRRIYALRRRDPKKPMIVLVGGVNDLERFGVRPGGNIKKTLKRLWPGPVSIVLPQDPRRKAFTKKFRYLHRGTKTFAFRLPAPTWLRTFLKMTGPLVAPSANFEGMPPAKTIRAAKKYFGDRVDFYVDAGRREGKPSTLVTFRDGQMIVMRAGARELPISRVRNA